MDSTQTKTIMMVEPDVLIRMVIAEHLRDCGYRVIEGVAAQDVWAVLESGRKLDIVLADVKLAGDVDGFSLARRIRQTRSDIDVILTSGIAGVAQESHDLCEEGPIKKPYEAKDVEARIRNLVERRRASKN
ncbi:MAG: response regulator [Steroidobacteraceae bacterium]|jgi:DNA-binding response OmpR family regulator